MFQNNYNGSAPKKHNFQKPQNYRSRHQEVTNYQGSLPDKNMIHQNQYRNSNSIISNNMASEQQPDFIGDPDRIFIRELQAGVYQKKMVGVVIGKFEMRSFPDRKNAGQMRYQMSFTLRDTAVDYINCTCWGQQDFITSLSQSFQIGDIIEVRNVMVQVKQNNEYEEKYKPFTPSQFQLVLNEQHASLSQYCGDDLNEFSSIAYLPIKDNNDYYTLEDILSQQNNLNGCLVNILAVVKYTGETKNITTKTGRQMKRREVKIFDDTCSHFPLIIWDSEIADFADTWKAKESVLFLFDIKVSFEEFRQTMVASCTSKTIIITNPDTTEAHHLYSYAQNFHDMSMEDTFSNNIELDVSSINDVYNLNEVQEKLSSYNTFTAFTGIVFACISSFDLDSCKKCITLRCSSCKRRVDRHTLQCVNSSCALYGQCLDHNNLKTSFEIPLSLSDHTSGLDGFMLSNQLAESLFGCSVKEFETKSDDERTSLKWNFLFERFKVYFKAIPPTDSRRKPLMSILQMEDVNYAEMMKQ